MPWLPGEEKVAILHNFGRGRHKHKKMCAPLTEEMFMVESRGALASGIFLHTVVLAIVAVSEMIGLRRLPIGIGTVIFLPILYAFALGIALNPNILAPARRFLTGNSVKLAGTMITIAIMPFIAKFGTTVGPQIEKIIAAGPALIVQEIGNLGTIFFAFPVAVFLLRMGREAVGATYSIDREPNLALIADKYGLNSPEGAGAMGVYATGTLIGTFVFAIMPPLINGLGWFDFRALAMSCGLDRAACWRHAPAPSLLPFQSRRISSWLWPLQATF
jgi:hypothetical protein